ncbi:octopressin receptor-like [Dreissena polymorpha]|uniref:octopressin receptor-like n=1 Tax=Dreissena polymorpha TaxID=45954 RepID=UPI0022655C28|nr:octopressin receptor-like [Dreissena polymorpha]
MDYEKLVQEKNDSNTVENIPIIVFMSIVCSAGIIGNFVALLFYVSRKDKSAATLVLTALSGNDLICSIVLLSSTAWLTHSMTYTNVAACKIHSFLNHVFVMNSMFLLFILALDRYLSICNTSKWKSLFARRKTVSNIVCNTGLSILFSIRQLVFSDVVPIDFTVAENVTLTGNRCKTTSEKRLAKIAKAFTIFDFILVIMGMILMLTLYTLIIRKVSSVGKRRCAARNNIVTDESQPTEVSQISVNFVKQSSNEKTVVERNRPSTTGQNTINVSKTLHWSATIERRLTKMAFILTLAFVLSFVPFFVVSIIGTIHTQLPIWALVLYRSYALNSTMNPYLIGYYNSEFREFVKKITTCRFLPSLRRK